MRITVDLIAQATQGLNPVHDYTLNLRGYKISIIENLGATQDFFECIDLSDNEVIKLTNFPPLNRIRTLVLTNNRISRIDPNIFKYLPNLTSLILTNNKIERLVDLKPIFQSKKLTHLSLVDNPITVSPIYRSFIIANMSTLKILDFKRVRPAEFREAKSFVELHPELNQEEAPSNTNPKSTRANETSSSAEIEKLKMEISQATTIEETSNLEKLYNSKLLEMNNNKTSNTTETDNQGGNIRPTN